MLATLGAAGADWPGCVIQASRGLVPQAAWAVLSSSMDTLNTRVWKATGVVNTVGLEQLPAPQRHTALSHRKPGRRYLTAWTPSTPACG